MDKQILAYLVPVLVLGLIVWSGIRAKPRKVRLKAMWLTPAVLTIATLLTLAGAAAPPIPVIAAFLAAAAVGGAVGWLLARHMALSVDAETGTVTSAATPIGTMLIAGLFVVRYALKSMFPEMEGAGTGRHLTQTAVWWTEGGMLFAAGMIWGRAITTWLRASPLLTAHKATVQQG